MISIAEFYFGIGAYGSAIKRCEEYLSEFSDGDSVERTLFMLGESNRREGNLKKAKHWFKTLVDNFPESEYQSNSSSRLEDIERQLGN